MKPLVIYHANCTDGFGAAFAAWLKLGDEAEYIPMDYMKTDDKSSADLLHEFSTKKIPGACISGREVFILDFSLPRCVMDWIFQIAKCVVWLDHHKTAFEMWCGGVPSNGIFEATGTCVTGEGYTLLDNNKSGALIAWEYFHPITKVPKLVQHIDDRDRWQFKLEGSKELHAALASYEPWTFEMWEAHFLVGDIRFGALKDEGAALLRAHNQHTQAALKQARACAIHWNWKEVCGTVGYREAVGHSANAPSFLASDLGHELANQSGTFGLVWSMAGDGQVHCSLRSNGEYDVSAIAKAFGGGGHRNAAGFSVEMGTLLEWLK